MKKHKKLTIKRRIVSKLKRQNLYDPRDFLSPRRIDIAAKVIFARAYLEGNTSHWPEYVYKEHLRAFNNFYEEAPLKTSFDEFRDSFIATIEGVKSTDNWKHKAPIEAKGSFLMNGAHRAAASIAVGDYLNTVQSDAEHEHSWGYEFFRTTRGDIGKIDEEVLDYMTIEYVSHKQNNTFAAVIFPTAEGHRDEVYQHLLKLGEIVNVKTFKYDEFIGKEVVKQLYFNSNNDAWNYGLDFNGSNTKANECFDGTADLQVYIIEANLDEASRIKEKEYLRNLWGKDKHSIHITDTVEEVNRVARMFFNENSRRVMKVNRTQEFSSQKMYDMFNEYIELAPKDIIEREKIAIEGSAVFDLLNIRDGRDIDYISRDKNINFSSENIEMHDEDENKYHTENIDEIITNPKYYFYYKGYKFVDLLEVEKYKKARSVKKDPKDSNDLKSIQRFIQNNPQFGVSMKVASIKVSDTPLFSIIIPLYNKERYITQCLESIQDQNYEDWECIIVNDGSTDNSRGVVESLIKNDSRFKLINQKNAGPSVARNKGINEAKGTLIHFMDADDYYANTLSLELIAGAYVLDKPKAISGNIGVIRENTGEIDYSSPVNLAETTWTNFANLQNDYYFTRFFFDRKFIVDNNIYFPEYTFVGEDPVFLVKALSSLDTFLMTNIPVYVYNTVGSVNADILSYSDDRLLGYMTAQAELLKICDDRDYKQLSGHILNRIDREMFDIYIQKAQDNEEFAKKLTTLLRFIHPELHLERIKHSRDQDIHIRNLSENREALLAELEILRTPGIKTAAKKLAGSVKRKLKK